LCSHGSHTKQNNEGAIVITWAAIEEVALIHRAAWIWTTVPELNIE
jgi:hypothetical protein